MASLETGYDVGQLVKCGPGDLDGIGLAERANLDEGMWLVRPAAVLPRAEIGYAARSGIARPIRDFGVIYEPAVGRV